MDTNIGEKNCKEYQLKLQKASGEFNTWNEIAEEIRRVTPKKLWKPRKADPHWWNLECYVARVQKEESLKRREFLESMKIITNQENHTRS